MIKYYLLARKIHRYPVLVTVTLTVLMATTGGFLFIFPYLPKRSVKN